LVLKQKDELEPAIAELRKAIELDPTLSDAHFTLGVALWQSGDFPASEREFRSAIKLRPEYAEAWYMLGTVLRQKGDLSEAASALKQAIILDPNTPGPFNTLAQVLRVQGDEAGSREAFRRGAEVKKRREEEQAAVFSINTGYDQLARGDLAAAEQHFRTAIAKVPDISKAHRGLAEVLRKKGQAPAANRELRLAEELEAKGGAVSAGSLVRGR
jgi:Tfp pilus assembly protein PilF